MTRKSGLQTGVLLVACLFLFTFASVSSFAKGPDSGQPLTDQQLLQMYAPAQIQAFRAQFDSLMANMSTAAALMGAEDAQQTLALARSRLLQVPDAGVARWMAAGVDLTNSQNALARLLATLAGRAPVAEATGAITPYTTAGFPTATYLLCGGTTDTTAIASAATNFYDYLYNTWIPANRACQIVAVILGNGGSAPEACIPVDMNLAAARQLVENAQNCINDTNTANIAANYARLAYINEQVDADYQAIVNNDNANTSSIISNDNTNATNIMNNDNTNAASIISNDNTNATNIMNNDNTNTANIISNDNTNTASIIANDNANTATILAAIQALAGQQLQIAIEANLSSSIPTMGFFETPSAQGGHLEDVAQIVTDTISNLTAAGQSVGNANYYLSLANSYYGAGRYKLAYYYYGYAYRSATNAWS